MKFAFSLLVGLLLAQAAPAEIEMTGPVEPVEPRESAQVFVDGVEIDELPLAYVNVYPREQVTIIPARMWSGRPFILFTARKPGKYLLEVVVPKDGPALEHAEVIVEVKGGEDDEEDDSDPPVPPPGELAVIVLYESETRTPAQFQVAEKLTQELTKRKLWWRNVDQDFKSESGPSPSWLTPYLSRLPARAERALPMLLFGSIRDGGHSFVAAEPMPDTVDGAVKLVQKYGG